MFATAWYDACISSVEDVDCKMHITTIQGGQYCVSRCLTMLAQKKAILPANLMACLHLENTALASTKAFVVMQRHMAQPVHYKPSKHLPCNIN